MKLLIIIIVVCIIGFLCCNAQNPKDYSNSELILHSILDPRTGLFRPQIFDIAKQTCPIPTASATSGSPGADNLLHDPQFLAFCDKIRLKSLLNATVIDQICSSKDTNWKTCGDHLAPDIDKCFVHDNSNSGRAMYTWKFSEGFSNYFCQSRQNFIDNLIEKSRGTLVCDNKPNPDIEIESMSCLEEQEKINPRKRHTDSNVIDMELCRSYDIVQFCVNQIYKRKCPNSFEKVTRMLAEIKTQIDCKDFKSPLVGDGRGDQQGKGKNSKKSKNGDTSLTKETSVLIPILTISLIISFARY